MAVVFLGCLMQLGLLGLAGYWAVTGFRWGAAGLAAALLALALSRPFNAAMTKRLSAGRPSDGIARVHRLAERGTRMLSPLPGHRARRRAQVLHLEGRALADAGRHQEAAGKLARAECLAALGRTEEAVDAQRAVVALLDGPGAGHTPTPRTGRRPGSG
ncbi:hypothetical protein [Kitasatospora herbaricolor]|uniref:hypothetical protein n=1 Tax=Kitasatospora herbaricolor TaxID=68217 RepID=UPI0036DBF526